MRRIRTTLHRTRLSADGRWCVAKWVGFSTLVATVYGIVNDQITVTLSPEYFSVFKREQFGPFLSAIGLENAPTRLQSVAVGILATWWFGLLLGIILSLAGASGDRPPISTVISGQEGPVNPLTISSVSMRGASR